jgi:hypothetical protein
MRALILAATAALLASAAQAQPWMPQTLPPGYPLIPPSGSTPVLPPAVTPALRPWMPQTLPPGYPLLPMPGDALPHPSSPTH